MALWAGRFSKEIDAGVNAFNSSIAFDARMYRHDIQGSIAHATMLGDCGIISKEDSKTIIEGLTAILADLDSGKLVFTTRGYGHGVGMSQYGANAMAKGGADWQEILCHYYPAAQLVQGELPA